MKATIYLDEANHNGISLDGTLLEYMQGSSGSTLVLGGGANREKLLNLFSVVKNERWIGETGKTVERDGLIKGSVLIVGEENTETLYFPVPVRVHIGVEV